MSEQLTFDVHPLIAAEGDTIQARFDSFHASNGWVADALEALVKDQLAHGRKRVGVKNLVEVIRWNYSRATSTQGSSFRLNNTYTSRYARLLIDRHPEWADVLETRELRAA